MDVVKNNIGKAVEFTEGLRFEFFYALSHITDNNSSLHQQWKRECLRKLPKNFYTNFEQLGSSHLLWPIFATLVPELKSNCSYEELLKSIQETDLKILQRKVLLGFIHDEPGVNFCLERKLTLKETIARSKSEKREWLIHVGLYPYSESSALVQAMEFLITHPSKFKKILLQEMDIFWSACFKHTWKLLLRSLQKSAAELQTAYSEQNDLTVIFDKSNVKAIYNESKKQIEALRGGYTVKLKEIKKCYFIPSAFNQVGWWNSLEDQNGDKLVFFPYFDPVLNIDLAIVEDHKNRNMDPDPFLIFKSLGDPTRFAMIKMIAEHPMSSTNISRKLSLSKATVSHHVSLLRQAGLLEENYSDGQVMLGVKQETFEKISEITCSYFKINKLKPGELYGGKSL
ncbi:MAG: winged helix-turn-helix transcriptional regulator [Bdellovibrio sp.]|nr:winged helix-turn-helix transcriptional regulator [Bdellovibrio sp.]